jgi:hypothetical protein
MKKLLTLLFSLLISFNSYGEWTPITQDTQYRTYYIDIDTIKQHNDYVYFWTLTDSPTPDKEGDRSVVVYEQLDCGINRYKRLTYVFYREPMGKGAKSRAPIDGDDKWRYFAPGSSGTTVMKFVCDYVD